MTTIPIWFDKPANVWLGIVLLPVLVLQIGSGVVLSRGRYSALPLHRLNALLAVLVVAVHAYWGIGNWFFDFKLG